MQGKKSGRTSAHGGTDRPLNHLADEKSPYLRQHAGNPVDWYPWGEEAFSRAAEEDKPVFLSIGYATCHWSHVMARESFEDDSVAAILNEHFIAIKVDREERPDIDRVYMAACQQMTGQGGWPLTIVLTPQKEPFFAGTYFPKSGRGGMAGLLELLPGIAGLWKEQRADIERSAQMMGSALRRATMHLPKGSIPTHILKNGYDELAVRFDPVHGGFGRAPKFPTPTTLLFLLRYWKRTGSAPALRMVTTTLDALQSGGIYDHLGGGFHRYSTDAGWRVPHFEKMLTDQALLLMAFSEAWLATKKPEYRITAEGISGYVLRDLLSAEGGFITAEDADSEEGEGAYYVWTKEEFDRILGTADGKFAASLFGLTGTGNFVVPESGRSANVLFLHRQIRETGTAVDAMPATGSSRMEKIRRTLLAARNNRPRPLQDDKILADWNGLVIAALAQAHRAFGDPVYRTAAERAMHFILSQFRAPDGGLLHRYCDGEAAIPAFADDYAFIILALIGLFETTFDPDWLKEAIVMEQYVTEHFHDKVHGGYFSTSEASDPLILRTKEVYDGALPSCNSVMLQNLVRLGHFTGDPIYHKRASALATTFAGLVNDSPSSYTGYLCGLDHLLGPATDIVIAGTGTDPYTQEMIGQVWQRYLPSFTVFLRSPGRAFDGLDLLAPFTRTMEARDGKATAYICHGTTCSSPVTRIEDLVTHLDGKKEK
jgi:uncharacterized protein YyaL (SSP411 family)